MEVKTESGKIVTSVAEEADAVNKTKKRPSGKPKKGEKYDAGGVHVGERYYAPSGNIVEDF